VLIRKLNSSRVWTDHVALEAQAERLSKK
jgi:hypothetical protein